MIAVSVTAREWPLNFLGTLRSFADITDTDMSIEPAKITSLEGKKRSVVTEETCGLLVLGVDDDEGLVDCTDIDPLSIPVTKRAPFGETSKAWIALGI